MLSFIIGIIVFAAASVFLHYSLDNWGINKGMGRTLLVLTIASVLSYGAVAIFDHFSHEPSPMDQMTAPPDTPDTTAVPMQ